MLRSSLSRILLLNLCVLLATGCASVKLKGSSQREAESAPKPATSEAVQAYEKQRADALYQAACSRWEEDNIEACEKTLHQLLTLQPANRAGRLMLADLYAVTDRPSEAQRTLNVLLRASPNDPQVHHSLGLLLESQGQSRQALEHLEQSVKLEPDNELYALSYDALYSAVAGSTE